MTVTCAGCGTSMAAAEVTQRPYDGVAGNYHRACAYMEYLWVNPSGMFAAELALSRNKLYQKWNVSNAISIAAPAGATAVGTTLGIGVYKYAMTFVDANGGESAPGAQFSITTTTGNTNVALTGLVTHPQNSMVKSRRLYRTAVAGSQLKLLHTFADNTTTTYTDNTADAGLGANAPATSGYALSEFP